MDMLYSFVAYQLPGRAKYEKCGLSTTEAEYVTVSEVVKEIKFLYQLLLSMGVQVPLPIKIKVDNIGTIWLANNSSVSE